MSSMLDDPHRLDMEEAHPDYCEPPPTNAEVRRRNHEAWQKVEAANAEFRRRSRARLGQLEAPKEKDRED
jgi:hypothetical protein